MKKEEYLEVIEKITEDKMIKNIVWNKINKTEKKEKERSLLKKCTFAAAAVAIVCVAGVSVPAVASEIRSLILRETPSYEPLADSIETAVFSKSDDHITVSVDELLTDGIVVDMTVKYTALDETGKKWLETFEAYTSQGNYPLNIKPYMPNTIEYGVNYSYGTFELEDRAAENERVYRLMLNVSGRTYSDNQGVFTFPMTDTTEKAILDISGNLEIRSFSLKASESASDYYTPTYIEISPMSFVIYANNHGVYERFQESDYREERWLLPDEEIDSLEDNSYFIMKDGTYEMLPPGAHNATHAKPDNMYSDVMLYSANFQTGSNGYSPTPKLMNLDDFEAIVINGVRFEFE